MIKSNLKCKNIIIIILTAISLVFWLMVNHGVENLCDELPQISQWYAMCVRGCIALIILLFALISIVRSETILNVIAWCVLGVCSIESIVALMQLYGFDISHHVLYKETGSFYNPGPLGGYLAIGLPIAIGLWCNVKRQSESLFVKIQRYILIIATMLFVIVLPSTMSRTAWVAAIVGGVYVGLMAVDWSRWQFSRKAKIIMSLSCIVVLLVGLFALWQIKLDSANGRLYLWRISAKAVMLAPFAGSDSFQQAFAKTQEDYYEQKINNQELHFDTEIAPCATPDYAFNEYLHYAIEWGLPLTIVILAVVVGGCIVGHRRRRYCLVGGMLSIMVFSCASYPMHIPAFVAIFLVILLGCFWPTQNSRLVNKIGLSISISALIVIMITKIPQYNNKIEAMIEWERIRPLYEMKLYEQAIDSYKKIYEQMRWNGRFDYEYGHTLHKAERYPESNTILHEAEQRLVDPMVLNIMGKNYQAMHQYAEAEKYFLRSTYRLPDRMYSHFLLYNLYSDPNYTNPQLKKREKDIILTMKIKVESDATREMREVVEKGSIAE